MKKKNIIIVLIMAIVGALIFWKRDSIKRRLGLNPASDSDGGSTNDNNSVPVTPGLTYKECKTFPLKLGCKGKNVENVQKALNKLHGAGLKEDGYFGPKTETALAANGYGETVEKEDMAAMVKALISGKS
jgi:hypothetical protein